MDGISDEQPLFLGLGHGGRLSPGRSGSVSTTAQRRGPESVPTLASPACATRTCLPYLRPAMNHALGTVLVMTALLAPVLGQVIPGGPAPEVRVSKLLNSPVPFESLSELQGSAVLLEFWATWCGPCVAQIPHMVETHHKYADRGLVILAMSSEPIEKVEPFAQQKGMVYGIGIDAGGAASKTYGVTGIPSAFLIDKDGKVAWAGHPARLTEADIEKVLVGASPLAGKLTGQLEPVQMLIDKGQPGRALAALAVLLQSDKLTAEAKEQAAKASSRLDKEAKAKLARIQEMVKGATPFAAVLALQEIAARFEGSDHGTAAKAALERLSQDETGRRAVATAGRIQKARQLVTNKRFDEAWTEYGEITAEGDAAAREITAKEMAAITESGMRGYHADCMVCRVTGKACKDHRPR
jgi:peroxiredoxin